MFQAVKYFVFLLMFPFVLWADGEYVDFIIENSYIGDNVVYSFPQIGLLLEHCRAQVPPCKVRVSAPSPVPNIFKTPPPDLEVRQISELPRLNSVNETNYYHDLQFVPGSENPRVLIPPDLTDPTDKATFVWAHQNGLDTLDSQRVFLSGISNTFDEYPGYLDSATDVLSRGDSPISVVNRPGSLPTSSSANNVYELAHEHVLNNDEFYGILGFDKDQINLDRVAQWRDQVASFTTPPNPDEIISRYNLFPGREDKPFVVVNFETSKSDTDLVTAGTRNSESFTPGRDTEGFAQRLIDRLVDQHGPNANIVITNFDNLPIPDDAKKALMDHIAALNHPGITVLPQSMPDGVRSQTVFDALIGSRQTAAVISADTGPYHLASAVRRQMGLADTTHGVFIFGSRGMTVSTAGSVAKWGAPGARNYALIEPGTKRRRFYSQVLDEVTDQVGDQIDTRSIIKTIVRGVKRIFCRR